MVVELCWVRLTDVCDCRIDYLTNVLGVPQKEAVAALRG